MDKIGTQIGKGAGRRAKTRRRANQLQEERKAIEILEAHGFLPAPLDKLKFENRSAKRLFDKFLKQGLIKIVITPKGERMVVPGNRR